MVPLPDDGWDCFAKVETGPIGSENTQPVKKPAETTVTEDSSKNENSAAAPTETEVETAKSSN